MALDTFVQHKRYGGEKAQRHEALLERNWERFAEKWSLDAKRGEYDGLAEHLERTWTRDELYVPVAGTGQTSEAA